MQMTYVLFFVIGVSIIALAYAANLYKSVKQEDAGNDKMRSLSSFIHEGAMAFLTHREQEIPDLYRWGMNCGIHGVFFSVLVYNTFSRST